MTRIRVDEENNRILHLNLKGVSTEEPVKKKRFRSPEATAKRVKTQTERLTPRERKFCREYVKTGKAGQSVMNAGYNASNLNSAGVQASDLLKKPKIQAEIRRLESPEERDTIATAQEVMEMLTAMARGDTKDQFGLETSADTRLKALTELAKRTVDLENKLKAAQAGEDNTIKIKIDWQQ